MNKNAISPPFNVIKPLAGGCINNVLLVDIDGERTVVKKNNKHTFPEMLSKEKKQLEYLRAKSPVSYAEPLFHLEDDVHQYLGLVYEEEGENTSTAQSEFGHLLAEQHKISADSFGWAEDNYIGSLPQSNTKKDNWSDFYAENRLLYQTKLAVDQGIVPADFSKRMDAFCKELPSLFPTETPALLHGDLWGGNYFILTSGKPFLYDPACYYGHREMELGMTLMFGGFDREFYRGYEENYPLEKGWKERVQFTQLYPNLVHLNLFGTSYLGAIMKII